jgi:G:T-mismatch repair DNA endonuclease (very short patch repair protein)
MAFVKLSCAYCAREFICSKKELDYLERGGSTRRYCTRKCSALASRISLPDSIVERYLQGESCASLASFYSVSQEKVRKHILSTGTLLRNRIAWLLDHPERNPTRGKGHSEATRQKLREANEKQFSTPAARERHAELQRKVLAGSSRRTSRLEDTVAGFLDELQLAYKRWALIRGDGGRYIACVDFLLEHRVILEVQGDYWHANPRIYLDGPKNQTQVRTAQNDLRKLSSLTAGGFRVVYLWEADVKSCGVAAVRKVLHEIITT